MLVSIVVTCYNRADMVCTALDSVWKQTYRPIELIIVDDGSKDNSFDVIQQWHKNHPDTADFTTVARTFPNGKLCVARNRGLDLAHGDYIQYVDDDDWLYPDAIEKKVAKLNEEPDIDLLVNQIDFVSNGKIVHRTNISVPGPNDNPIVYLLQHECLMSPVLMFKTETLRRIGQWKEGLIFADDMEITMRLAILGGRFGLVNESLSGYRIHSQVRQCTTIRDRLSDDFISNLYDALFQLALKQGVVTDELRKAFAEHLLLDGKDMINHGRYEAAKQCFSTAKNIDSSVEVFTGDGIPCLWRIRTFYVQKQTMIKAIARKMFKR